MAYNQYGSRRDRDRVTWEIREHIGVLADKEEGWKREVNVVAWNGADPKVDIRDWDPNHRRMTKGITLFENEAENLVKALAGRYGLRVSRGMPAQGVSQAQAPAAGQGSAGQWTPAQTDTEPPRTNTAAPAREAAVPASERADILFDDDPPQDSAAAAEEDNSCQAAGWPEAEEAAALPAEDRSGMDMRESYA